MSSPLFRNQDSKSGGLESRFEGIYRFKNSGGRRQEKNTPSHPPGFEMYLIIFLVYLINCAKSKLVCSVHFFITSDTGAVPELNQVRIHQASPDQKIRGGLLLGVGDGGGELGTQLPFL